MLITMVLVVNIFLVHFSFEASGEKTMLLDLQWFGYHLFHPYFSSISSKRESTFLLLEIYQILLLTILFTKINVTFTVGLNLLSCYFLITFMLKLQYCTLRYK